MVELEKWTLNPKIIGLEIDFESIHTNMFIKKNKITKEVNMRAVFFILSFLLSGFCLVNSTGWEKINSLKHVVDIVGNEKVIFAIAVDTTYKDSLYSRFLYTPREGVLSFSARSAVAHFSDSIFPGPPGKHQVIDIFAISSNASLEIENATFAGLSPAGLEIFRIVTVCVYQDHGARLAILLPVHGRNLTGLTRLNSPGQ